MIWDLEEQVEDAIAAYLSVNTIGLDIYTAWSMTEPKFPCAVIHCGVSSPISDTADFNSPRAIKIEIAVMSEAASVDKGGGIVLTPRQANSVARAQVMSALAITGDQVESCGLMVSPLAASMNATGTPRALIVQLQLESMTRSVDEEKRRLISTIELSCIAVPKDENE